MNELKISNFFIEKPGFENIPIKAKTFSDANLVYSSKNSTGKTTFLRALAYTLGFNVGGTKNVYFPDFVFHLTLTRNDKNVVLTRKDSVLTIDEEPFYLPEDEDQAHAKIFEIQNLDVLHNLLGCFYFDQENGWNMLDSGIVLQNVHFNVDEYLRGINGFENYQLLADINNIREKKAQYLRIKKLSQMKQSLEKEINTYDILPDDETKQLEIERQKILFQIESEKRVLQKTQDVLKNNISFKNYVDDMQLLITTDDGKTIRVTSDNLVGQQENYDILRAKIAMLNATISNLSIKLAKIDEQITKVTGIVDMESTLKGVQAAIRKIDFSPSIIESNLSVLNNQESELSSKLKKLTFLNNVYAAHLETQIIYFAKALEVDSLLSPKIFGGYDKKGISGSNLYRLSFCFKAAYVKIIEEKYGIVLPLLIDSPQGAEIEEKYIQKIYDFLFEDFKNNQKIISSLYDTNPHLVGVNKIIMDGTYFNFEKIEGGLF